MVNYEKMYAIICAAASEAVDRFNCGDNLGASRLLKEAMLKTEEMYISEE